MRHAQPARFLRLSRRLATLERDRRGATAVETALVLPLLLSMFFGIVEVGHLVWTVTALNMAVEDAARCASVSNASSPAITPCDTSVHTQSYAAGRAWGMTIPASTFTLSTPSCGYQVSASYAYTPIVSYIPLSMTLSASACFPAWK
jgi:Flp pilus assembly protein TadG